MGLGWEGQEEVGSIAMSYQYITLQLVLILSPKWKEGKQSYCILRHGLSRCRSDDVLESDGEAVARPFTGVSSPFVRMPRDGIAELSG